MSFSLCSLVMACERRFGETVIIIDRDVDVNALNSVMNAVQHAQDGEKMPKSQEGAEADLNTPSVSRLHRLCYTLSEGVNQLRVSNIQELKAACWLYVAAFVAFLIMIMLAVNNMDLDSGSKVVAATALNRVSPMLKDGFPAVTLCNNNILMKSASNELIEAAVSMMHSDTTQDVEYDQLSDDLTELAALDSVGWLCFYFMAQHKLSTMLVKCKFGGRKCGADDFTPTLTERGLCYTFNAGDRLRSKVPIQELCSPTLSRSDNSSKTSVTSEIQSGKKLELWLTAQQEEYTSFLWQPTTAGFWVNIAEKGKELPLLGHNIEKIGIGLTDLRIKKETNQQRPSEVCMYKCMMEIHSSQCGCIWYYDWTPDNNVPICDPVITRSCLIPSGHNSSKDCQKKCDGAESTSYSISGNTHSLSMATLKDMQDFWPYVNHGNTSISKSDSWKLAMGLPLEPYFYWKENLVVINIEMSELLDTSQKMKSSDGEKTTLPYTANCYLSTVLSVLLFCTGFTLLTGFKMVVMLFRVLMKKCLQS